MQTKDIINHLDRERLGEIIRFGIVGVMAVAIQYSCYCLLNRWMHPEIANTIAYLISFCFNYVASTRFTFRVKSSAKKGAGFALSHVINYMMQQAFLALFLWLGMQKDLAMLPVFCICVPVNFLLVRVALKKLN